MKFSIVNGSDLVRVIRAGSDPVGARGQLGLNSFGEISIAWTHGTSGIWLSICVRDMEVPGAGSSI